MTIEIIDAGLVPYLEGWELQKEIFQSVIDGGSSTLIELEHPNVYTLGKSGVQNNLLVSEEFLNTINATFVKVDRGGDITYHGPGQLVGYPIMNLNQAQVSLRDYIFKLEQSLIDTVAQFGITAARSQGATGVWVDNDRKIAAIGVRASRGVTMHGMALNVSTDLSYFSHINPCGFVDRAVTSIERETGRTVEMSEVKKIFATKFTEQFSC